GEAAPHPLRCAQLHPARRGARCGPFPAERRPRRAAREDRRELAARAAAPLGQGERQARRHLHGRRRRHRRMPGRRRARVRARRDMSDGAALGPLDDPAPHARLLSNGRYTVLLTGAGTGYSAWNRLALTAWAADRTEDADGLFVYWRETRQTANSPTGSSSPRPSRKGRFGSPV